MDISQERLKMDIKGNATFGAIDAAAGRGRTVLTGTDPNRLARDRLVDRLEDTGLEIRIDEVGNIVGRWDPPGASGAPIAAGSHLDSVPAGGIFDGPLGVYAALESVRAMQAAGHDPDRPVEVVSFTEEEGGRFGEGLLGSEVAAGKRTVDDALARSDDEGETLGGALDRIDYRGEGRLDASAWEAWLELHVEQHTALERAGVDVGEVTTVTGITHCRASFDGEANHAGTTPMADRTDALAAASEFILDLEASARERTDSDDSAVGTVGRAAVKPSATNVIPGHVELGVDIRSVDSETMEWLVSRSRESLHRLSAERHIETHLERGLNLEPTPMSERCRAAIRDAGRHTGVETTPLHSGAAHDTMHIASVTDAGMLFAPSNDGISHSPREWTDWADCAAATGVLACALADLANAK